MTEAVASFEANTDGRDFVVGDIHGMFPQLEALLEQVSFDTNCDRLFSVGDLVDRGRHSRDVLRWLDYPWFHPVRGNHDQFVIDSGDEAEDRLWIEKNGGGWWLDIAPDERERFRAAMSGLPWAIEVRGDPLPWVVIHADVPPDMSWPQCREALLAGNERIRLQVMWSRKRAEQRLSYRDVAEVAGCSRVYVGHTPMPQVRLVANMCFMDTGAAYTYMNWAQLSLCEHLTGKPEPVSVSTY